MKPLYLLVLLATVNHLAINGSRLIVMLYAVQLNASPAVIGLLAAMFGLVSAFMAVHVGRWIDRVGPRGPLMLASVMMGASTLAAGLWHGLAVLFVVCPLIGTFNSMFQIAAQQAVGRYGEPRDRASNFSIHSLGISAATFLGPLIAGLAIDHLGHSKSFLLMSLFGFLPLAVTGPGLLRLPERPARRQEGTAGAQGWALLRDRPLRRAYIVATMNNGIWSVVGFMIPLYGAQIGLSATRIGTLMACLSSGTVGIRLPLSHLVRRFRPWALVIAAQSMMGIGFLGMPLTQGYFLLALLAFTIGTGLGLSGPVSTALMYDAAPPERVGEVVGLRMTMANVAQTVIPMLSGAVGAAFGVAPVFWTVAAAVLADAYSHRDQLLESKTAACKD